MRSECLVFAKHEGLVDSDGNEMPVATADNLKDALHYARMYGQDGPTRVVEKPKERRS